jgi:uncharacterized membrane protein
LTNIYIPSIFKLYTVGCGKDMVSWIFKFKKYEIPLVGIIIFLIITIWSLGMILAPLTLPQDSVSDLTGTVGPAENQDQTEDMNAYARFYYQAGDGNCHTIKERSFFINGNQMPFCVRDVAIFFGMALGMGIVLFIRFPIKLWWIIGGLIPIGLDGGIQLVTSYESNNVFRLLTGGLAGVVTMLALGFVIYDISKDAQMRSMYKKQMQEDPDYQSDPEMYEDQEMASENSDSPEIGPVEENKSGEENNQP